MFLAPLPAAPAVQGLFTATHLREYTSLGEPGGLLSSQLVDQLFLVTLPARGFPGLLGLILQGGWQSTAVIGTDI